MWISLALYHPHYHPGIYAGFREHHFPGFIDHIDNSFVALLVGAGFPLSSYSTYVVLVAITSATSPEATNVVLSMSFFLSPAALQVFVIEVLLDVTDWLEYQESLLFDTRCSHWYDVLPAPDRMLKLMLTRYEIEGIAPSPHNQMAFWTC